MTDVEKIALWVGLISSIVSIVLSIVAILFAWMVDKSSRAVSDQTIRSLQKIESDVQRLSSDTSGLIKAGWDRMLGTVGKPDTAEETVSAKEMAAGLLAELRAQLGVPETDDETPPEQGEQFDAALKNLRKSLEAQFRTQKRSDRPSQNLEDILRRLNNLSLEAQALARIVAHNRHLTFNQFQRLLKESSLGDALSELRDEGLLVPLEGLSPKLRPVSVYYFPPGLSDLVRAAFLLMPEPDSDLRDFVLSELRRVGYKPEDIDDLPQS